MLTDSFGRPITYLRISVTDRCNLRCVYCMPAEGIPLLGHAGILRFEEITAFAKAAAAAGVSEIRLTGGEPLVRQGLPELVAQLAAIPGIRELSLTTNGLLLERYAAELKQAGLKRVNISLDTLRPERFARVTRGGSLEQVWRGILAAEAAGLLPLKINAVAIRGFNSDEFLDLARLALDHPWHVRFIEYMPISEPERAGPGELLPDPQQAFISSAEILAGLSALELEALPSLDPRRGPAREYRPRGGQGLLGFISPLSDHFCESCNRLRLTADGHLRPCLLSDLEIPILPALRAGEDLRPYLEQAVGMKPAGHELAQNHRPQTRCMTQIGG